MRKNLLKTNMAASFTEDLICVSNAKYAPLDGLAPGSYEAQQKQRDTVERLGFPLEVESKNTEIVFRLIPSGSFCMGSTTAEQDMCVKAGARREWVNVETQHHVTLTKSFYCGKYEITQTQWEFVMENNPSNFKNAGKDAPVEQISWYDCQEFIRKLCQKEGVSEGTYRLLTEAEWECACRAGTSTALYNGDLLIKGQNNGPALDPIAWYGGNCGVEYSGGYDSSDWKEKQYNHQRAGTHIVGTKQPNAYGLYDMIGNVWEWCQDFYGTYPIGSTTDPSGSDLVGVSRVFRGSSWFNYARNARSANRNGRPPELRRHALGLRLARITTSDT